MTQEEKQLLLKDLCARLLYEVKLDNGLKLRSIDVLTKIVSCSGSDRKVENVRPYLRPMSSMTKEECTKKKELFGSYILDNNPAYIDWLNAHHFDYRGLIEKGLAIDCTNLNIY